MYRQGDVLLMAVHDNPQGKPLPRENGRVILAHGEATGHAHALVEPDANLYQYGDDLLLTLPTGGNLVHDEHNTIVLPPGNYMVVRQREYTPKRIIHVAD